MKKVALWTALGSLFLIPFLALYVDNGLFFPFITGKNFAFRILVEIAFVAWVVLAVADKNYRPKFSWTFLFFGLFMVWMAIANSFAMNPHKAFWSNFERMEGYVALAHVFLFFVVSGSVLSVTKLWRKWWLTFLGGSFLVCLYGLMQMAGKAAIHQGSTRVDASLGNAEYLAGYMLFAIAIALWQAFETKGKDWIWLRYSLFALAILEFIILVSTQTRGAMIALVGALGFGALVWMIEAGKRGRQGAATFLVGLLVLVGGFYTMRESAFVQSSQPLSRLATIFSKSEFSTRFTLADMAFDGIAERPITGWGQEGYNYVFNKFYKPSLYAQEPWFDRAHNIYIDWTIAGGIPALFFFLGILLSSSWALYRANASRAERIILLSALGAYAIEGLAVFDNLFTYIPLAGILAMAHVMSSKEVPGVQSIPEVKSPTLETAVAPLALVAVILSVWMINIPSMRAGSLLIGGLTPSNSAQVRLDSFKAAIEKDSFASQEIREQLMQFAQSTITSSNDTDQKTKVDIAVYTISQVKEELVRAPNDARLRMQFATLYRALGQYEEAAVQSKAAHDLAPNKQGIIIEQGLEALQAKDNALALEFFTQAYELDHSFPEAVSFTAAARILTGDTLGGKALLMERFGTTTVNHQALILAYYQKKDWPMLISVLSLRDKELKDVQSGFQLAAAYAESGDLPAARVQVRKVMKEHPDAAAQGAAILTQLGG